MSGAAKGVAAWHAYIGNETAEALDAMLADDAVFHSPVVHTPQVGKAIVAKYLLSAAKVLNGDGFAYVRELIDGLHRTMIDSGLFEITTIRTRAEPRHVYKIADGNKDNVFLQVIARIRPGRSVEDRKTLGNALLANTRAALAALPAVAIGVEVHELDPEMLFRHMTIK